jgi:hypothetical protein
VGVLGAAESFLALLDDKQRTAVSGWRSETNLSHWSYRPDQQFKRAGLRLDTLSEPQREAALAPALWGAQPANFQPVEPLKGETVKAFALMATLDRAQRQQAVLARGITHIHAVYREPGNDYGAGL